MKDEMKINDSELKLLKELEPEKLFALLKDV
jgi:hypothetical protein